MRWWSVGLSYLLILQLVIPPAPAQEPAAPKLNLVIVEGDGAINNIKQRTAREPIVQVEDENHRPIAGAAVMFSLPNNGASGVFANGGRSVTVLTDSQGRAVARGLKLNKASGQMQIRVNASYQGQTASTVITQTNMVAAAAAGGAAAGAGISGKMIAILVAIGAAGAVGGAIAATHGGNSNSAVIMPSTTITPGSGTVGAPH
jgi:hypothetical protein